MSSTACAQATGQLRTAKTKLRGEIPTNPQPAWLSDAVRQTVHRERGLSKVILDALDCAEYHVTDIADPTRRVALRAYEIVPIVLATSDFAILDALEAQVGRRAFVLPPFRPDHGEFFDQSARCFTALSETVQALPEILRDGRIDGCERAEFLAEAREAQAALARLIDMVDTKAQQDAQPEYR
jgi:hypothetical protein